LLGMLARFYRRASNRVDWAPVLRRSKAARAGRGRPDGSIVLCATSVGAHTFVTLVDSLVAMGLYLRGSDPRFLLCDSALPACERAGHYQFAGTSEFREHGPKRVLCPYCFGTGESIYRKLPLPLRTYSEFVSEEETNHHLEFARGLTTEESFTWDHEGVAVGAQVKAGVLRFLKKSTVHNEDPANLRDIVSRYFAAALTAALVAERALDEIRPDVVVAHHGIYVPQGILGLIARKKGVRVVNWGMAYRDRTVIYSHSDTYHRTLLEESDQTWERHAFGPKERKWIDDYLGERWRGKDTHVTWTQGSGPSSHHLAAQPDIRTQLGLHPLRPVFCALTNVLWDAGIYYGNPTFESMLDWLFTTVDYFSRNPEKQLVIRVHPHEAQPRHTAQRTETELRLAFPNLPENICLVEPESKLNTYALMNASEAVLIYGTKAGLEASAMGKPVVVAGEAWIRNKGFTIDVTSRDHYLRTLETLPDTQMAPDQIADRAKRYAYYFFYRRMIPLPGVDTSRGWPPRLALHDLQPLIPGNSPGLDVICNGILEGGDFAYDG